jgi:hypothetical protein
LVSGRGLLFPPDPSPSFPIHNPTSTNQRSRSRTWSISRITLSRHRETALAKHHERLARKRAESGCGASCRKVHQLMGPSAPYPRSELAGHAVLVVQDDLAARTRNALSLLLPGPLYTCRRDRKLVSIAMPVSDNHPSVQLPCKCHHTPPECCVAYPKTIKKETNAAGDKTRPQSGTSNASSPETEPGAREHKDKTKIAT